MARIVFVGLGNMGLADGRQSGPRRSRGDRHRPLGRTARPSRRRPAAGPEPRSPKRSPMPRWSCRCCRKAVTLCARRRRRRRSPMRAPARFIDSSTIHVESACNACAWRWRRLRDGRRPGVGRQPGARGRRHAHLHGRRLLHAAFARAKPILEAMGKTIVHAGTAGAGQAAKICNNMILGDLDGVAVCEGFALADGSASSPRSSSTSTSSGQRHVDQPLPGARPGRPRRPSVRKSPASPR